jgi:hypothetical protein
LSYPTLHGQRVKTHFFVGSTLRGRLGERGPEHALGEVSGDERRRAAGDEGESISRASVSTGPTLTVRTTDACRRTYMTGRKTAVHSTPAAVARLMSGGTRSTTGRRQGHCGRCRLLET